MKRLVVFIKLLVDTFKFFCDPKSRVIDKSNLTNILGSIFAYNKLPVNESQTREIIEETFLQVDTNLDGVLDYNEYKEWVLKNPSILTFLTIDVHSELR